MPKLPPPKIAIYQPPQDLTTYIGIDPGVSGGIATIREQIVGDSIEIVAAAMPMKVTEKDIWLTVESLSAANGVKSSAVIEWIHPAILGVSKKTMSVLYANYSMWRLALTAAKIPYDVIQPRKWQQALGISPRRKTEKDSQWKGRLRGVGERLFPNTTLTNKTADAMLIADYCRRFRKGML